MKKTSLFALLGLFVATAAIGGQVRASSAQDARRARAAELTKIRRSRAAELTKIRRTRAAEFTKIRRTRAAELTSIRRSRASEQAQIRRSRAAEQEKIRRSRAAEQARIRRLHTANQSPKRYLASNPMGQAPRHIENIRDRAAERVERTLNRDSQLGRFHIDVNSKGGSNGIIELNGRTSTQSQSNRASSIAHSVASGYSVVNHIHVGL